MKLMLTSILLALVLVPLSVFAATPDPAAVIRKQYAQIDKIIQTDKTDEGVRSKVVAVLESFTDFREFSRMTLKKHWKGLSEKQRVLFTDKYRQLLHKSYVRHFKANQELTLGFRGEPRIVKTKAMVLTTVKSGKTESDVDYKMHLVDGKYRAYDIVIDEVSLMRNYRKQFGKIIKRDGFDVLIQKIQKKIDTKDDEDSDVE
jgi:phospholipid transport system substrate-binding protein